MGAWKERERTVWSCRLCALPEEDEAAGLEEELRARRLGFVEDARALRQYIQATGCSQEECARRLGRTQPAVANRLRLLRLPEDILAKLSGGALTERHGRALLRLESEALQRLALDRFLRDGMSVAEAESYVDRLAAPRNTPALCRLERRRHLPAVPPAGSGDLAPVRYPGAGGAPGNGHGTGPHCAY